MVGLEEPEPRTHFLATQKKLSAAVLALADVGLACSRSHYFTSTQAQDTQLFPLHCIPSPCGQLNVIRIPYQTLHIP
jgi:hypothetical protein